MNQTSVKILRMRKPQQRLVATLALASIFVASLGPASIAQAGYAQATGYFRARDYASAATEFFQAYAYPKEKGEKRKSEFGLAQSLQQLNMYYAASKYYSLIVRRGPKEDNPFFTKALDELGNINAVLSLGQSHIVQLFRTPIESSAIPGRAKGFYFYYQGAEAFNKRAFEEAKPFFDKVPSGSPYYLRALLHLGVIANISGRQSAAISYFERVIRGAGEDEMGEFLREVANLNVARVHYEARRYREALAFYNQIPRDSDSWLQAIFESAWAFFMYQKHNNVLGQIHTLHSPFFENRFYPESYVLQAITFLRLCRYDQVKVSLQKFRERYGPVFADVRDMLRKYEGDSKGFFNLIYKYRTGELNSYKNAWSILDSVSRMDPYKEAGDTIRFADREIARLSSFQGKWASSGLQDDLVKFLQDKKRLAIADAGRRLYDSSRDSYEYLQNLSGQTKLINAEMLLGKIDQLRAKINVGTTEKKVNFIGGMTQLSVGDELEYWPFQKEYWEDELGAYVFNIDSVCGRKAGGKKGEDGNAKDKEKE